MNLLEFQQKFATEEACLLHLEQSRWGRDGENRYCPHCGSVKTYKFKSGKLFKCGDCRKQFTVKVGTIFSDSKIPLTKWYLAIYLASSLKKGISSVQLSKYTGVTQKTAWFMLHRIRRLRTLATSGCSAALLADETYQTPRRARRDPGTKGAVFGMLQRGGQIRTMAIRRAGVRDVLPLLESNVVAGSTVYTNQGALSTKH